MNPTVGVSLLVIAGVVGWSNVQTHSRLVAPGTAGFRELVSLMVLAAVLSMMGEVSPQIAGPFAILIALSVALAKVPSMKGGTKS